MHHDPSGVHPLTPAELAEALRVAEAEAPICTADGPATMGALGGRGSNRWAADLETGGPMQTC
jgi:hypothetical protein